MHFRILASALLALVVVTPAAARNCTLIGTIISCDDGTTGTWIGNTIYFNSGSQVNMGESSASYMRGLNAIAQSTHNAVNASRRTLSLNALAQKYGAAAYDPQAFEQVSRGAYYESLANQINRDTYYRAQANQRPTSVYGR
jgi:hypothetical protein